jgi:hypothetical protein
MNFLLTMIGRGRLGSMLDGGRPGPRHMLLANASAHAARGELDAALAIYRRLGRTARLTPLDLMIRGHLRLMAHHDRAAQRDFSRGAERLLLRGVSGSPDPAPTAVEHLLSQADAFLRRSRYVRAADLLQRARSLLEVLLSAQAGMVIVESRLSGTTRVPLRLFGARALIPLTKLSDLTLRLLARTHLATHLAASLRERRLREDLAPWATTAQSIDSLLECEFQRLDQAARSAPGHAEWQYRLGLMSRVTHRPEAAERAFARTLDIFPHHVPSAVRLAAAQAQSPENAAAILERAFLVPVETLRNLGELGQAAVETIAFDRAVDGFCNAWPDGPARATSRANLAFALSELAALDPVRAAWREAVPA